jgi:predicted membrane protein
MNRMAMKITQIVAVIPIGRPHRPSVHGPASNRSPARTRRKTGATYATYSAMTAIDVTAAYATVLYRYGRARMNAPAAASQMEFVGVRVLGFIRCQKPEKGTAPSRENA